MDIIRMDIDYEECVYKFLKTHNNTSTIAENTDIKKLYDIFINDIIYEPITLSDMHYLGIYYKIKKDYDNMMKYYLMAIDGGYARSMNNLGIYYENIKDYENMIKYYLMAIDKGHSITMFNLGLYYQKIKDYENMIKYYLMAIEKGHDSSICNLGFYYQNIQDYENMIKYYLMGVKMNHPICFNNLSNYYLSNDMYVENLNIHIIYYNLTDRTKIINQFNKISDKILSKDKEHEFLNILSSFEFKDDDKLCTTLKLLLNTFNQKIELLELHFKYSVNGLGYEDAKRDFINRCIT